MRYAGYSVHHSRYRCPQSGAPVPDTYRHRARRNSPPRQPAATPPLVPNAYQSTYKPFPSRTTLIRNATILTAAGPVDRARVHPAAERQDRRGRRRPSTAPADALVIDASGKWVTPGVIDTHSHLGVYAAPGIESLAGRQRDDQPEHRGSSAEHSIWPQDPQFDLALAGGVTTMQILPGSGNLFGGRGVTVKNVPSRTAEGMKFPGAPYGLKMACGENPKRVYGSRNSAPQTRMGNVAGYRRAWQAAAEYRDSLRRVEGGGSDPEKRPARNLQLETLAGVLDGEILVHNHCYRADEMATMINIAREFGYKITSFHHAVEAYKIRDLLVENNICASMWADWWGFKLEAYDGIRENIALVDQAKGCAIVHSDDRQRDPAAEPGSGEGACAPGSRRASRSSAPTPCVAHDQSGARRSASTRSPARSKPGKNADVVIWTAIPSASTAAPSACSSTAR